MNIRKIKKSYKELWEEWMVVKKQSKRKAKKNSEKECKKLLRETFWMTLTKLMGLIKISTKLQIPWIRLLWKLKNCNKYKIRTMKTQDKWENLKRCKNNWPLVDMEEDIMKALTVNNQVLMRLGSTFIQFYLFEIMFIILWLSIDQAWEKREYLLIEINNIENLFLIQKKDQFNNKFSTKP